MKISDDVLTVLSASRCEAGVVFLPEGQLDRKLYVSVNKVLEALGGKWNKKTKGHVFTDDPATRLDDAIVTGEVDKPADFGFFETPEDLCEQLVDVADIQQGHRVLEPSAGTGNIVNAILKREPSMVTVIELQSKNVEAMRKRFVGAAGDRIAYAIKENDFTLYDTTPRFDRCVMNPPFAKGQDVIHVTRAFDMLREGGKLASIMSAGVEFRQDSRTRDFRALVDKANGRIERLPEGSFKKSGTMVRTVLVTMNR